jgi:hypothetical protein
MAGAPHPPIVGCRDLTQCGMARPIIAENPPIINVFVGGNGAKIANRFMAVVNSFSKIAFNCGIHRRRTDRFTLLAEFREQSCARHHRELSRPIQGVARDAQISRKSRGVMVLLSPMLCRLEPRRSVVLRVTPAQINMALSRMELFMKRVYLAAVIAVFVAPSIAYQLFMLGLPGSAIPGLFVNLRSGVRRTLNRLKRLIAVRIAAAVARRRRRAAISQKFLKHPSQT